jgi:hypothetical protein
MRFQDRDGEILQAIDRYDGMLAKRQLKALFWPQTTQRAMELRLAELHEHGYLAWPTREHWRTRPIPEPICWLGWQGALWLAGQRGLTVEHPRTMTETGLRRLAQSLKAQGQRWVREPRWSQLAHDIAVADVRLAVERSVQEIPHLKLAQWVTESEFRARPTVVPYTITLENGKALNKKRGVIPDGYFEIVDERRQRQGLPARAKFLLEVDMGTHDHTSFFQEKVLAGMVYLQSPEYAARFGNNTGRWLVVAKNEVRVQHLVKTVPSTYPSHLFCFIADVTERNFLMDAIWIAPGASPLKSLLGS